MFSGTLTKDQLCRIDPGIRETMRLISSLPFVRRTVFSCAGFGLTGDADTFRQDEEAGVEHEHPDGYFVLVIDPSSLDARQFLRALRHTRSKVTRFKRFEHGYNVWGDGTDFDSTKMWWARVHALALLFKTGQAPVWDANGTFRLKKNLDSFLPDALLRLLNGA